MVPNTNTEGYDADFTTGLDISLAQPVPALGAGLTALLAAMLVALGLSAWRRLAPRIG